MSYVISGLLLILILLYGKVNNKTISFALLVIGGGLFPMLNVDASLTLYAKMYLVMLPLSVIFIEKLLEGGKSSLFGFFFRYSNIMGLLALSSLFFWIFGSLLEIIPYTFIIPNDWFDDRFIPSYYGIYFETQNNLLANTTFMGSDSVIRNSGFFNEAPMYNMNLCFALSIELYLRQNKSLLRIILFVVTILTTFSSTGYFFLLINVMIYMFFTLRNKKSGMSLLIIPFVLIIGLSLSSSILENKQETGESSYNHRYEDIVKCIEVGLNNPIIGVGIFHPAKESGGNDTNYGFSNSLFTTFAHGGFYFFFLYFFSLFIVPFSFLKETRKKWPVFLLCYFFLFTFTLSQYWHLTLFMVALGLACFHKKQSILSYGNECRKLAVIND